MQRIVLFRYVIAFIVFLLISVLIGGIGWVFWQQQPKKQFGIPIYTNSDKESQNYWKERILYDIDASRDQDTKTNLMKLQFFVTNTLNEALQISSDYAKIMALTDIALTLAQNDVDLNIDEQINFLANSPLGQMMLARIYISQALMKLRTGSSTQARVLIRQYLRIVIEQNLKLGNDTNEMSFSGAVTVLAALEDSSQLNEIFDQQISFSLQLPEALRMRAFRFIAGEQARVGMNVYAMSTIKKIKGAVELARAYQQIIFFIARPKRIELVEPSILLPQTTGPWNPLQSPEVARQIISDVVQQIASQEDLDMQIDVLMQLAGSRLMCDPAIHLLLREIVDDHKRLNDLVKYPVLKLLDNPESALIRASLGKPPLPQNKVKNIDPALDDWKSTTGVIAVDVSNFDSTTMETLNVQQTIQLYNMTAQCYLMVNRHQDAIRILQKAFVLTKGLSDKADRVANLLRLGEKQITARDFFGAKSSFLVAGLPNVSNPASEQNIYSDEILSRMARLQIAGRFFEDAVKTIACIPTASVRDDDYVLLIKEYIRINRLIDAEYLITQISDRDCRKEMEHLLGITKDGTAEHYKALDIPYPNEIQDTNVLKRVCEYLISQGLLNVAAQTAEKITGTEIRTAYQIRIIQEYLFLLMAYGEDSDAHRNIRKRLIDQADRLARRIETPIKRAAAFETLIAVALPHRKKDVLQQKLISLLDESLITVQHDSSPPEEKGNVMARLILSKIVLEAPENSDTDPSAPLINQIENPELYDEIMKLVNDTVVLVNEMNDVPKRGYTIVFLAQALRQLGRSKASQSILKDAEEMAKELSNAKDTVSLLLSIVPSYQALNKIDDVLRVYNAACDVILKSYAVGETSELIMEWRTRDSELERIISSQLEQNYLTDAVLFTNRMNDQLLKDRLLRTAAYIYMDKNEVERAEMIARRIRVESILTGTIRDVLFAKRNLIQ